MKLINILINIKGRNELCKAFECFIQKFFHTVAERINTSIYIYIYIVCAEAKLGLF